MYSKFGKTKWILELIGKCPMAGCFSSTELTLCGIVLQWLTLLTLRTAMNGTKLLRCRPFLYKSTYRACGVSDISHTELIKHTIRVPIGGGNHNDPIVEELSKQSLQYHGIGNISHLQSTSTIKTVYHLM